MTHKIIGKYIKELNFNIPNAKTFFLLSADIVNYKINIDIKSDQVKENTSSKWYEQKKTDQISKETRYDK